MNEQNKWIPVSNQLPPRGCYFWVLLDNGKIVPATRDHSPTGIHIFNAYDCEPTMWNEMEKPPPHPPSPFDEWWNGCGMADGRKDYRFVGWNEKAPIVAPVLEATAKLIWDAAMDSMKGKQ